MPLKVIDFYQPYEQNGWLANFSQHSISIAGQEWPTVEHYFQSRKFKKKNLQDHIQTLNTPHEAKEFAKLNNKFKRSDWNRVRFLIMYNAVKAKFTQYPELKKALLNTNEYEIRELAPNDTFWGVNSEGIGENRMGKLLMKLRDNFLVK